MRLEAPSCRDERALPQDEPRGYDCRIYLSAWSPFHCVAFVQRERSQSHLRTSVKGWRRPRPLARSTSRSSSETGLLNQVRTPAREQHSRTRSSPRPLSLARITPRLDPDFQQRESSPLLVLCPRLVSPRANTTTVDTLPLRDGHSWKPVVAFRRREGGRASEGGRSSRVTPALFRRAALRRVHFLRPLVPIPPRCTEAMREGSEGKPWSLRVTPVTLHDRTETVPARRICTHR